MLKGFNEAYCIINNNHRLDFTFQMKWVSLKLIFAIYIIKRFKKKKENSQRFVTKLFFFLKLLSNYFYLSFLT